jgi:RNA polymerase sigma factor (sigma-70 family)
MEHLRDLFNGGTVVGLTDGQLLSRYAASHDGPAFEALVARHGPMVLATCTAILRHEHDVEDAFQATFFVLARKAGAIRAGETLGGWLHRVAYRVAVQANIAAKRRRVRESEVLAMATATVTCPKPEFESDLGSILHEEINRLPEGQRLPVVLCDLEGLSYEQAAQRLGWTVPTLGCRLAKARQRLRARLTRRGVTASTIGVLTAARTATAAVPTAWTRAAVAAATTGTTSATVAVLTQTIIRGMLMTKMKTASMAVLIAAALASVGVVAVGAGRPDDPKPVVKAPIAAKVPTAARDNPPLKVAPGAVVEVRGRVVGPDGKPIPRATLRTAFLDTEDHRTPEATSDPDGRFLMRIPRSLRSDAMLNGYDSFPWVVATAPGFGAGYTPGAFKAATKGELTIKLVEDGPPIEGRIVDLEGRPVASAEVKATRLYFADRTAFLAPPGEFLNTSFLAGLDQLPATIATATTNPEGRFRLTGIGPQRIAELSISGPAIATTQVHFMSREGGNIHVQYPHRMLNRVRFPNGMADKPLVFQDRQFEQVVEPTKPIEGVVRDKDSGQPIAGLTLHAAIFDAQSLVPAQGIETTTDAQGRYRLTGLPKAPAYRLFVEQGEGKPYAGATFRALAESPAFEPVAFDIALKRGILIRGRVTDKATGQPVPGYLHAFTFQESSFIKHYPGYVLNQLATIFIKDDGRYEVVGLPGRNIIACRSEVRRYRGRVGAEMLKGYDPKLMVFYNTLPLSCYVNNYHVLAEIDVDPKAESATLDLQVDPGRTVTVTAVDPEGKPIGGTKTKGVTDLFSNAIEYDQESPTFEINALDPSNPRRVIITHAGRKLIGTAYLKGDEASPVTIHLQPWGVVTGRVVDEDGQPLKGLSMMSTGGSYPERPDVQGVLPGDGVIGSDGRFRVEGLVPGLKYGASASGPMTPFGNLFHDLMVAPGEVKDLGDLKVAPPKRDGQP